MKVLLINPPQTFYPGSDAPAGNLPLGLMYIAAMLEQAGYKVEILDAFMTEASFLKVGDTLQVGMPYGRIKAEIERRKPQIIGIANPFTCQVDNAVKVAQIAKDADPAIVTVVGGPHVTVVPTEFLNQAPSVDIAVIGEGEYTMLDITRYVEGSKDISTVQGIAYRKGNTAVLTPPRTLIRNLDELPYPAYHLVNMEQYLNPAKIEYRSFKKRAISMITSRGCPFNCCFCSVHLHMGKAFRAHSADYVVNHIAHVVSKYRVKTIFFEDDNLTFDLKRFEAICDKIIEKGIKFAWETPNGIRADYLTLPLLEKMKKSGCQSVFFGIESGDQHVLDNIIGKSLNLKDVVKVAKMCRDIGLKTGAFYIIGFPGEKKENMMKTVSLALRLKRDFDVGMHLFYATPSYGTRLYEECKQKGYLTAELTPRAFAEVRQTSGVPLIETEDFLSSDVKEIAALANKEYKKLSLINHFKNPGYALKTALNYPNIVIKYLKNLHPV
ncbi:MAG: B12-binding domain-containing radical SAM protein [Candidatus Bathyarchaeota archaeon]|nr:B12-binding domain-containing radical SAM protein [Candidatus Bathyarchaeota archaeon]